MEEESLIFRDILYFYFGLDKSYWRKIKEIDCKILKFTLEYKFIGKTNLFNFANFFPLDLTISWHIIILWSFNPFILEEIINITGR